MNRYEATIRGLKTYRPEKPCKHGHKSDRFVSNNVCVECYEFRKSYKAARRNAGIYL